MYSIVEISGHQYKVDPGTVVDVQKLPLEVGAEVELDKVYYVSGSPPLIGLPVVKGAIVRAKVLRQDRSPKILVLRRKKGLFQKKKGHRQSYTALLITEVDNGQGQVEKMKEKPHSQKEEEQQEEQQKE